MVKMNEPAGNNDDGNKSNIKDGSIHTFSKGEPRETSEKLKNQCFLSVSPKVAEMTFSKKFTTSEIYIFSTLNCLIEILKNMGTCLMLNKNGRGTDSDFYREGKRIKNLGWYIYTA